MQGYEDAKGDTPPLRKLHRQKKKTVILTALRQHLAVVSTAHSSTNASLASYWSWKEKRENVKVQRKVDAGKPGFAGLIGVVRNPFFCAAPTERIDPLG